jgi:DNA-binding CsgD family transcriptional regulator
MKSPPLEKTWRGPPTDSALGTDVLGLVRQLVEQFKGDDPGGDGLVEVMLDVQVDGVRCLLMRVPPRPVRPPLLLSPREREIARMVARGYPNKTIAHVLDISSWTVNTYLRRIFSKLNVGSRASMVARLMEEGLLGE